eukprot:1394026-Amorphochlora_amoeboformis.AAC.1
MSSHLLLLLDSCTPVFASCGRDKAIKIWDLRENKEVHTVAKAHDGPINSLSFNPLGDYLLATCSDDKTVALWDTRNLDGRLYSLDHRKP